MVPAMTQPPYGEGQPQYGQRQANQPSHPGQYGQPQQQYGQYGQPYSATAAAYGEPVGSGAKFGVVGVTLVGIGAVLLIIAFTAVNWYKATRDTGFGDISDALDRTNSAAGVASAYFGWLAWLLLVALVIVGVVANLPSPASGPLRALGGILAAAAIALTFFAVKLDDSLSMSDYLKNARVGFYLALAGFLIAGIGALIGPTRTRTTVVRTY